MIEKLDKILLFLGAISVFILPALIASDYKKSKAIDDIYSFYYDMEDKIIEMSSANDDVIKNIEIDGKYYTYDDFKSVLFEYEDVLQSYNEQSHDK